MFQEDIVGLKGRSTDHRSPIRDLCNEITEIKMVCAYIKLDDQKSVRWENARTLRKGETKVDVGGHRYKLFS